MKDDLISRQAAIDTDGLDEEIRCEMCKNPMHTSKGCDGNCEYDERLYERIMQILGKRIKPLPSAHPEIIRCKDCKHKPTGTDRDSYKFPDDCCPCKCEDYWYSWNPDDDWFCANGERKSDG